MSSRAPLPAPACPRDDSGQDGRPTRGLTWPRSLVTRGGTVVASALLFATLVPVAFSTTQQGPQVPQAPQGQAAKSITTVTNQGGGQLALGPGNMFVTEMGWYDGNSDGDSDDLANLPWTPAQNISIDVEKFSLSLGTLVGVEVRAEGTANPAYCVENLLVGRCQTAVINYSFVFVLTGQGPATNCGALQLPITGGSSPLLGGFDSVVDCVVGEQGLPPTGSCSPNPDHVFESPLIVSDFPTCMKATGLTAWSQCGSGQKVSFGLIGQSSLGVQFQDSGLSSHTNKGRVRVEITYEYIPNAPPECVPMPNVIVNEDDLSGVSIDLWSYVQDPDGFIDCDSFEIVLQPMHGTLTPNPTSSYTPCAPNGCGTFPVTYTPDTNYCGSDIFGFKVRDDDGLITTIGCPVRITVLPVNDAPQCAVGGFSPNFCEDVLSAPINFCNLVNDIDDSDACNSGFGIDCSSIQSPVADIGGSFQFVSSGIYRYLPPANYCGPCVITFSASDTQSASVQCQVNATVQPTNDPPFCIVDPLVRPVCEDQSVVLQLCEFVDDPDGSSSCGVSLGINCNSIGMPTSDIGGTFQSLGLGRYRFSPPDDYCGPAMVSFMACDFGPNKACEANGPPACVNCVVEVEVRPRNDCPVAVPDSASTSEDTPITIDVLMNDFDNDGLLAKPCGCTLDPSTVTVTSWDPLSSDGQPIVHPNGSITFTPAPNYCGVAIFEYTVSDSNPRPNACGTGCCESNTARVTVTIDGVNDCPVASDDHVETFMDIPVLVPVCNNDIDVDDPFGGSCGFPLDCTTVALVPGSWDPACAEVAPAPDGLGNFLFVPKTGFQGLCEFRYTVCDRNPATGQVVCCSEARVIVNVRRNCEPTNLRRPASLLLYPEYDNREGIVSILTVTNTSHTQDIDVKFEYVNGEDCSKFDRTESLTANDTLTLVTNAHNPSLDRGYVYVYAKCNGQPVVFNYLIGQLLVVDGLFELSHSVNAIGFEGIGEGAGSICNGLALTDVNGDGKRNFDAIEYSPVPDRILIPRFFGQTTDLSSQLILIALSGGPAHETHLDFLLFNDNEEAFSTQYDFNCWDKVDLLSITGFFDQGFLQQNSSDPEEILGDTSKEAGWFWMDGNVANSPGGPAIIDPAFYGLLIEQTDGGRHAADLPFGDCDQLNGDL